MKYPILKSIVDNMNEDKSLLSAVKEAFALRVNEHCNVDLKATLNAHAFSDDNLNFDQFIYVSGFVCFHETLSRQGVNETNYQDIDDLEFILEKARDQAVQGVTETANDFTATLLNELSDLVTALGQKVQVAEVKSEYAGEIVKQLEELAREGEA